MADQVVDESLDGLVCSGKLTQMLGIPTFTKGLFQLQVKEIETFCGPAISRCLALDGRRKDRRSSIFSPERLLTKALTLFDGGRDGAGKSTPVIK